MTLTLRDEINALLARIAGMRQTRDFEVESIRMKYQDRIDCMVTTLRTKREELRRQQEMPPGSPTRKMQQYLESEDAPVRHCKGCGHELLRATVGNAERFVTAMNTFFSQDGKVSATTVKRLRNDHCCSRCAHGKQGHSYNCTATVRFGNLAEHIAKGERYER